ncbi:TonB-dependent hemoglobin/transferrin/lactoferrin family receptor [Henriciella sp.]|uniref:TonB-dependent hemoglobin/transferrin/lactoferrin family receptor n=1 Tax=Henriciella sp. TaxID=1968823 RepID=UPI00261DFA6E|nr:TonB-dependent hemoglobin/transferrin/lactoferrin family receptor [Henriciella sp.]
MRTKSRAGSLGSSGLRSALFISVLTAIGAGPVFGQAVSKGAQEEPELRAETITVYGTSNPIPVFDYPGQVSVIDRDEIDRLAPSAISDMLRDVPGLEFSGGPRRTGETPSLRGLSGQNVLILLDGARQSFASAHDGRFFTDPSLIGKAEVVKGPASALYGSGAVGGVLAFETVDAADLLDDGQSWGVRLRGGYQSVNEESFGTVTAFTRQGKFDGLASFSLRQSGDIELGSGATLPSDDDIQTGLLKGSYEITDALSVEGSWQRFENTAIEPNNGQGTAGTGDSVLDRDVEKEITTDAFRAQVNFNPVSNKLIDASLTGYQTTTEVDEYDQTIPRTTIREIETTGVSARNAARFNAAGMQHTITVGGDWYRDEQTGIDTETADGTRGGVPNGKSEFTGVFAQLESSLETTAGDFLFIPGIRYDKFENRSALSPDENSDEAVSPRFAASYAPMEWLRIFGSYSEGFRAPSINELYLDGTHFEVPHPILFNPGMGSFVFVTNEFVPNPDLVPEETETVELGAGVDFDNVFASRDRLQAKVSYYESEVENMINLSVDFAYDPTCFAPPFFPCTAGTSESANIDSAEIEGWEGELRYDSDRFFMRASYSSIDGRNAVTGSDIGSLTPDRVAVNFGLKVPEWNARFGSRIQHASDFSRREADGGGGFTTVEQRDSYAVLDLYASWAPEFARGLSFNAGVDNVFDEDYERIFQGVSEPGRNYKIAATWQFGG